MPAPGPLYVHERPVGHSDFRIGQSYYQDFIEQMHVSYRAFPPCFPFSAYSAALP
jgi:hypothetical protein